MTRAAVGDRVKELGIWLDIRFWLCFFFVIRLFGITNAPLEIGHNWRQSLTNMVARNFVDTGADLLRPVIDIAGEKTGIIGTEFPFFNYLIYLVSSVFGYAHWYGRGINLVVTTIGVYFFYKLIKDLCTERVAFFSAFILCVSVWFGFGRKSMPDTFSVALVIIGIYYGYMYLKAAGFKNAFLYFVCCTLGVLCKIPALSLFSVLGIALFIREIPPIRKVMIYGLGTMCFVIVCTWYFYWVPHLVSTYGFELYFPRTLTQGLKEVLALWPQLLEKFYFVAFSSFVGFATFLGGVYFILRDRKHHKLMLWSIAVVSFVFFFFIIKTGLTFPLHSYYVVPYVPIMALVAGYFLASIEPKYAYILLAIIAIESVANQQDDMFLKSSEMYKLTLEGKVDSFIPKEDLIIVNGTPSPQLMYFAHRKGWTEDAEVINSENFVDSLTRLGARYVVWDRVKGDVPTRFGKVVYQDTDVAFIRLETSN